MSGEPPVPLYGRLQSVNLKKRYHFTKSRSKINLCGGPEPSGLFLARIVDNMKGQAPKTSFFAWYAGGSPAFFNKMRALRPRFQGFSELAKGKPYS